jgi:hypothetical protein
MISNDLIQRFEAAFKDLENINAEEYQKIIEENAAKASENAERLTLRLLSLVMVLILVALGEISELNIGLGKVSNQFIILVTLLVLVSYTHYDLVFTISKFDQLSVIHKIIIKHRHYPIHQHGLSKFFLFAPALYEYVYSTSEGFLLQKQHNLWLAELICITYLIPFGSEIIGLLSLNFPLDFRYSFLYLGVLIVIAVFNLQSGFTLIGLFSGKRTSK